MANRLFPGTQLYVYILRSHTPGGTFTEAVFTNKTQAEAAMRLFRGQQPGHTYSIQERVTEPHEV